MPVLNGLEAAQTIRECERKEQRRRVPIIALTGHSLSEVKVECNEAGMDDVLTKPIAKHHLLSILQQHIPKPEV
jgi:CheY-like chemotaxis protein